MSIRALILFIVAMAMIDGVISSSLRGNYEVDEEDEECLYDKFYGFKYISNMNFEDTNKHHTYKHHPTHNVSIPNIYGLNKWLHGQTSVTGQTFGVDVIGFVVKKYIIKGMYEGMYNNETKIILSMAYRKECQGIPTDLEIKNEVNTHLLHIHEFLNSQNISEPLFQLENMNVTWVSETQVVTNTSKYFNF